MSVVFDTGALSAIFIGNEDVTKYFRRVENGSLTGYIPRVILAEFFYKTWQKHGRSVAEIRTIALRNSAVNEVSLDENDVFTIGRLKTTTPNLSLADCSLAAVAIRTKSIVLTTEALLLTLKEVKGKKISF